MDLLVLGGTHFVGRAVVVDALRRGWAVTAFNHGGTPEVPGVRTIRGDRRDENALRKLGAGRWDAVVDTWSGAPRVVRDSAAALAGVAGRYLYVSSGSVYAPPPPVDGNETAPTVDASPDAEATEYPADKRGAELAVELGFGERWVSARAGLILGPHEDVGRLPWWLLRMHRGGRVLAPGPPDLGLQHVDARDLATWLLDAARDERSGVYNVVGPPGAATMRSLLEACRAAVGAAAELVWVPADDVLAAGIEPWTELPIWLPPDHESIGMHHADVARALATGLRPRPIAETVADTWAWLREIDLQPPQRPDRPPVGLDAERERAVLDAVAPA
jgi:nucleoside-diphosphate-sugar epimerase